MNRNGKAGLVVVLKDEVHDIAGWLAWHIALGFDAIIVIDDASTDGTDRIIRNASLHFDVRYEKVVQEFDFFYDRQQNEYKKAIKRLEPEFSWLCFLDSDEYLLLEAALSVQDFLKGFTHAHGIVVNWRLHGNNGHVLRPLVPAPVAYPRRSQPTESINRHVKSFVRPDRVGTNWHNVHCFDVDAALYVNTNGKTVQWSATIGIIDSDPVFSGAWIMHFQNRSMEHFIDRARKRQDTLIATQSWSNESWNAENDESANRFFTSMFRILATIESQVSSSLCGLISSTMRPPDFTSNKNNQSVRATVQTELTYDNIILRIQTITTCFDTLIQVDPNLDLIVHSSKKDQSLESIYVIRSASSDTDALLICPTREHRLLRLRGDRQAGTVICLQVELTPDGLATFRSPSTRLFLSAEPIEIGTAKRVSCDRRTVQNWEMFNLTHSGLDTVTPAVTQMAKSYFALTSCEVTASSLCTWISENPRFISSALLQILLRKLSKNERSYLGSYLPAFTPVEALLDSSRYS